MTVSKSLFRPKRVCCVCGCEASSGRREPIAGEPRILAITAVVYRRGSGKGQLRNAPKVQVCEECLSRARTNGRLTWMNGNDAARKFGDAIGAAIFKAYTKLAEDDAFDQVQRPDWRNPEESLL